MEKSRVSVPELNSPYLKVEEAALYLRISQRSLEHFRSEGNGPPYRKHGGAIVYHIDELDRWSAGRRFESTSKKSDE